MNSLNNYRKQIDQIDNKILELLSKRIRISKKVGKYKAKNNLKIRDLKREKQLLRNLEEKAKELRLNKKFIKSIYELILKNSRDNQID